MATTSGSGSEPPIAAFRLARLHRFVLPGFPKRLAPSRGEVPAQPRCSFMPSCEATKPSDS
jgi:hypothetical protein